MKESESIENEKKFTVIRKRKERFENNLKKHCIRPGDKERVTKKDFQRNSSEVDFEKSEHKPAKEAKKLGSHRLSELHFFRSGFKFNS